jgi:hypothetical protein
MPVYWMLPCTLRTLTKHTNNNEHFQNNSIWGLAGGGTRTPNPWRTFWRTIENGFIGHDAAVGARGDALQPPFPPLQIPTATNSSSSSAKSISNSSGSSGFSQWLIQVFSHLQPPGRIGGAMRASAKAYKLLQRQGSPAAGSSSSSSTVPSTLAGMKSRCITHL